MSTPIPGTEAGADLATLDAITEAVESGAGLPEVVRAAARALDASLVLLDRAGQVLAVAARSPADERSLMRDAVISSQNQTTAPPASSPTPTIAASTYSVRKAAADRSHQRL